MRLCLTLSIVMLLFGSILIPALGLDTRAFSNDNTTAEGHGIDNLDGSTFGSGTFDNASRGFSYALGMAPEDVSKLMFIHPVEIKTGNISILNNRSVDNTVVLNVSIDFSGTYQQDWEVWLDEVVVVLGPWEESHFHIFVQGPKKGYLLCNILNVSPL